MAIQHKTFYIGETEHIRRWSDLGVKIHGGFPEDDYDVAEDPAELGRTYTETDIPIDADEDEDYATAGRILMGVEE